MPTDTPLTTPLAGSIVATPCVPLVQYPPVGVLLRVVVKPMHRFVVPVIVDGAGNAFTVRVCCAVLVPPQPPEIV